MTINSQTAGSAAPAVSMMIREKAGKPNENWIVLHDRLGNNIRTLRTYYKYTQEYMASELDISSSAYSKIERNQIDISVRRLFQIASILGVSVELLIYLDANHITVFNSR